VIAHIYIFFFSIVLAIYLFQGAITGTLRKGGDAHQRGVGKFLIGAGYCASCWRARWLLSLSS